MNALPLLVIGILLVLGGLAFTYKDKLLQYIRGKVTDSRGRIKVKPGNINFKKNSRGSTFKVKRQIDFYGLNIPRLISTIVTTAITLGIGFVVFGQVKEAVLEPQMNVTLSGSQQAMNNAIGLFPLIIIVLALVPLISFIMRFTGRNF